MYHVTLAAAHGLDGVLLHHAVKVSLLLPQLNHKAVMRVHVLQLRQIPVGHLKVGLYYSSFTFSPDNNTSGCLP